MPYKHLEDREMVLWALTILVHVSHKFLAETLEEEQLVPYVLYQVLLNIISYLVSNGFGHLLCDPISSFRRLLFDPKNEPFALHHAVRCCEIGPEII